MSVVLSPEIRLAGPAELDRIATFLVPLGGPSFAERFPGRTSQDFYRWKYFQNPSGDAIVGVAGAGEAIVSVVAATPKRLWLSRKVVLAYELGDFLTDGNYRKQGLFSQLIELVCREANLRGAPLVYVRPNDVSFPILVGKLSFFEAQRIDARRFVIPSNTLSGKTGIPVPLFRHTGVDALMRSLFIPRYSGGAVTVEPVEHFGPEADQLWASAAAGYDFALIRDTSYLNWRFAECPTPYKMWRALRNGQSVGLLIASAEPEASVGAIVDLFTASDDEEAVRSLLTTAMNSLLNSGIQSLSAWTLQKAAGSAAHHQLVRALPFRRKQHLHLAIRVLRPTEVTLPLPAQGWHFTLGDSDGA